MGAHTVGALWTNPAVYLLTFTGFSWKFNNMMNMISPEKKMTYLYSRSLWGLLGKFERVSLSYLRHLVSSVTTPNASFLSNHTLYVQQLPFLFSHFQHSPFSHTLLFCLLKSSFCGANFFYSLSVPALTES